MQEHSLLGILRSPLTRKRVRTFDSIESARDFISSTMDKNSAELERVANGDQQEAFIQARFGYPTGREAVSIPSDSPIRVRTTYGVTMFIVHDSTSDKGFRIITAYPENAGED